MCLCHDIDKADITIQTAVMKKICKYHKKNGQEFHIGEIVPKGMCFEAFSVAYPSALALLYNADMKTPGCNKWQPMDSAHEKDRKESNTLIFQCPSSKNKVIFQMVRREKLPQVVKKAKHAAEEVFKRFFFPVDKIHLEHDVVMKVVKVEGDCPQGHKVGDSYSLNTQDTDILCPASFNSLYTFIQMLYKDVKLPWAKEKGSAFVHCPDHEGIIYKIRISQKRQEQGEEQKCQVS